MFVLELLGTLSLRGDGRPIPAGAKQRRPLGLLAILALGGKQGLSRERIEAYLWPESSDALARHALDQTVYAIRRALESDFLLTAGREVRLNPDLLQVDVWELDEACRRRDWAAAADLYKGTLLDGVHFGASRELESWIDTERGRLLAEYQAAVESLATIATEAGDHSQSVSWYRKLVSSEPLSARATKKLMLALADAGDRSGAVKHARLYQELVRQQLEMEPDVEIAHLASAFSCPVVIDGASGASPPAPPIAVSAHLSETPIQALKAGDHTGTTFRALSLRNTLPTPRSRVATVWCLAVLAALLIGAVTAQSWHRWDRRVSLDTSTALRRSARPLPAARDAYRRALDAWRDGSKDGLDTAVFYFRRATELDNEYAEAYAGLADAYVMLGYFGYRPRDSIFPKAKEAALRSIQLDSTLPSARPALAYELSWERDFAGADAQFRKAIALDPTHAMPQSVAFDPTSAAAHQWYGILLMILGHKPKTIVTTGLAAKPDPFSLHVPVVEIAFEKWFTEYPAMTGNTSYGPGTIAGEVLSRIDDGVFTHMIARYELTDPSGVQSFKAVIQGKASDSTGKYALDGIVAWGWMTGALVHVTFQRTTPCRFGKLNVCFQGTMQIQPR